MPRNKILPPVSFVTDLSNSGNSLIQKLFDKPLQNASGSRPPSFSERLRLQPVDSRRGSISTPHAPKPTRQENQRINQPDRLELPQPRRPLENQISRSEHSRTQLLKDRQEIPANREITSPELAAAENETVDHSQRSNESNQIASQEPTPVETQNRTESEDQKTETTEEVAKTGEIPAAFVKHVAQGIKQNEELAENVQSSDEASQTPVILNGLVNVLQGQLLPVQQKNAEEQASTAQDDETADVLQQDSSAFNSDKSSDDVEVVHPAIIDTENTNQNLDTTNQELTNAIPQNEALFDEDAAEQATPQQNLENVTEYHSENKLEVNEAVQVTENEKQPAVVNEQTKEVIQNQSENNPQKRQVDSSHENRASQDALVRNRVQNPDLIKTSEELPEQQETASFVVNEGDQKSQQQSTKIEESVTTGKQPAELPATPKNEDNSQFSDSSEVSSTHDTAGQYTQQYGQTTPQDRSAVNQLNSADASGVKETTVVEKLSEIAGQVTQNESADAAQTQKSVQVDSLSAVSSTSARSSVDGPVATQARPVLDITRSDMSQKLSSFIQQASDSGKAMRIRLDPPELGSLQIEVGRVNGQIVARIEVDNPTARALVFEQLQMLRDSLQQQGLRVDRLEVEINENLSREFSSDQSADQRPEEQQQRFAEDTEFAAENSHSDQNEQTETKSDSQPPQVVGVSEIDVQI